MTELERSRLRAGDLFLQRYRIERVLGEGAMGTVFAARHVCSQERVAIKCLLPAHGDEPSIVARFQRESHATTRLRSEHVARVLDQGEASIAAGGAPMPYLVMEYLEGSDLRSYMADRDSIPVERAADYVSQACVGLAEAHALGIVHRDLKPANLFRTARPDGSSLIKVLDFGVAKFESPNACGDQLDLTAHAVAVGSLRYMAPEQMLDSSTVDGRADIWSLGVILYQLVSGARPFVADAVTDLVFEVLVGAPRPLREVAPHLPAGLEEIVMRCLQKHREDRYPNMAELARALAPFAEPPISALREPRNRPTPGPSRALLELTRQTVRLELTVVRSLTPRGGTEAVPSTCGAEEHTLGAKEHALGAEEHPFGATGSGMARRARKEPDRVTTGRSLRIPSQRRRGVRCRGAHRPARRRRGSALPAQRLGAA